MEEKEYKYYLPNENNEKEEYTTNTNSIIILGANGSGKSRLGAWMEENCSIYRIPAQRIITIEKHIQKYPYEEAKNNLLHGSIYGKNEKPNSKQIMRNKYQNDEKEATFCKYDDYSKVLAFVLAKEQEQLRKDHNAKKHSENIIDKIKLIWKEIFNHRKIDLEKDEFICYMSECENKYKARIMSDGERAVLYLIMQVLCVENYNTILIDEPELHLHPSLTNKLLNILEEYRKDCLFINITHDMNFASNHTCLNKFWIKSYDGNKWKIEKIPQDEKIPENLFLELLGTRRNVLFVEGNNGSLDFKIYSILYPEFQIIPSGGCDNVIQYTKAFNEHNSLHNFKAYGVIDRDFRTQDEIDNLNKNLIYTLKVAEVENLLLLECVIKAILKQLKKDENKFENIKKYIFETKFKNLLQKQISENLTSEIKYKLKTMDTIKCQTNLEFESLIKEKIDFENLNETIKNKFYSVDKNKNYDEMLKIFNCKDVSIHKDSTFLNFFDLKKNYENLFLELLKENKKLRQKILNYIPQFTE